MFIFGSQMLQQLIHKDAVFFYDVPTFVPQITEFPIFSGMQIYTQFATQATRIMRKLFIFFLSKRSKSHFK